MIDTSELGFDDPDHPLFHHPDDLSEIEHYEDIVREACKLRELGEVIEGTGTHFGQFKFPSTMVLPSRQSESSFAALSYNAVKSVLMNTRDFSSTIFEDTVGQLWGRNIALMDPPEHTAIRAHVQKAFMPNLVASWHEDIIVPLMEERFAAIRHKGKANLTRELTGFYPFQIFCEVVGFDSRDVTDISRWLKEIMEFGSDPEQGYRASEQIKNYAAKIIADRRKNPRGDLISALSQAEVDEGPLPDDLFVGIVIHLLQGGVDTVFKISSSMIQLLLTHEEQFKKLKADRSLIPGTVEESLRYQGVLSHMPRKVMNDTELAGVKIPKGAIMYVFHGVANRDPDRWPDPHAFDITRKPIQHMGFGNGPHICIGMHLARAELALYLEHVLDDLPNLRWDSSLTSVPQVTGWSFRAPLELPVEWDIAEPAKQ